MSVQVANINLAAATVGAAFSIPIGQSAPPPTIQQQMRPQDYEDRGSLLYVMNESGCVFTCLWEASGQTFTLTAGAWRPLPVPAGETQLLLMISYIIPGAQISALLADLYLPGEPFDPAEIG